MVVLLHVSHFCCSFFFTTIVPRLMKTTNSQNEVALMIIGGDERASSLRIGAKKSVQEKNSEGSWGRERGRGVGRYSPLHFFFLRVLQFELLPLYSKYMYI